MTSFYAHIPFCQKKCFYCSFVVSIGQEKRMDDYLDALEVECQQYKNISLNTIYFGGGTPSLLSLDQLKRLVKIVQSNFDLRNVKEWTMEMNPDDVSENKIDALLEAGINRFSLVIQTFSDKRLLELGRNHSSQQALDAYHLYKEKECANVSVDLMFAFAHQTMEELEKDLKQMTDLDSEHVSIYCLNVEPKSRFYTKAIEQPKDEEQIAFMEKITSFLQQRGWEQYEVSNFAKPGFQSIHNRNYWEGGNYIGVGIGAHSYFDGRRFCNIDQLTAYIEKMQTGISCIREEKQLSAAERLTESVLFRLRMNEGVIIDAVEEQFQCCLNEEQKRRLQQFCNEGLLIREGERIKASDRGRLLLDEIAPYLLI